jgi:glyoxylase-like metal-dependent hydrolase (beta-lactamase superfamily II)
MGKRDNTATTLSPATFGAYRRYFCVVCGHVEWVPLDQELPPDYCCTVCGEPRSVMLALDDPRLARHSVVLDEAAAGILVAKKKPPFRADWTHYAYVLQHPDGVILYDAPPIVTEEAVDAILALGKPRLVIVSHRDFVGLAGDWARALDVPAWMGAGDEPEAGNRFEPDRRIDRAEKLADDLEVVPAPGHTPGSLAVYWSGAPDGPALFAGDAVMLCGHDDGRCRQAAGYRPS